MRYRFQPWQLAAAVIVLCGAALLFARWRGLSQKMDAAALIACLPPDRAVHVYIDAAALRESGVLDLLAGSKAEEEPDYRAFVEQTGFDYRSDLDAAAAAFLRGGAYFTLRGRFDWKKLNAYARAEGGECRNAICAMPASAAGRSISFYPIKPDVLALAVSTEARASDMIVMNQWKNPPKPPSDPVWISAPSFAFSDIKNLPDGAQAFLRPLERAQDVTFAIGPDGARMKIRLNVACADKATAEALAKHLTETTQELNRMLEREKMTPNPRDLSGVLAAGTFEQQDSHVTGGWPVDRGFIEALASGRVQ